MKAGRRIALLAALVLGLAAAAPAQELSLSFGAGLFRASEEGYREIYGAGAAVAADVWLKLKGPFGLAAGYGRISDGGSALPLGEGEAEYPVKLARTSVPVTVFFRFGIQSVDFRVGAGLCFHSYREDWETVDLHFKGHKVSPRFYAAASAAVLPRLSFLGSVIYDTVPTGAGSPAAANVNLGGIQLLAGLSVRIF